MRHFDDFTLDETTHELSRNGQRLALPGKAAHVLILLTERPGELLTRQQLHEALWPEDTFVDFDNNLNVAVRRLRQVLGDSATSPRYVETLPRRGLRFVGTLAIPAPTRARPATTPRRQRFVRAVAGLALALAAAHSGGSVFPARSSLTVQVEEFRNLSGDAAQDLVADGLRAELTAAMARRALLGARIDSANRPVASFTVRGTSRRDDTGLYVTAELIDRHTDSPIWAGAFLCPRRDLFQIQRRLAGKIGDEIAAVLAG